MAQIQDQKRTHACTHTLAPIRYRFCTYSKQTQFGLCMCAFYVCVQSLRILDRIRSHLMDAKIKREKESVRTMPANMKRIHNARICAHLWLIATDNNTSKCIVTNPPAEATDKKDFYAIVTRSIRSKLSFKHFILMRLMRPESMQQICWYCLQWNYP